MEQYTDLAVNKPDVNKKAKTHRRKMVFTLTFGIVALIFAMASATFVSAISLMGFNVVFTEKGLIPMATCLASAYFNATPAIVCGVLSQRLGMVCGLNKVSIALSIASCGAGTIIFMTLALAVFAENTGIFI